MKKFYTIVISLLLMQNLASNAQSLSPVQMDTLLRHHFADSNLVIIDVCTDLVYSQGHIQNAIHRDLFKSTFTSDLDTMDTTKLYVLHCISGGRSATAMSTMKSKGFTRVYDISGGITNWRNSGYPLSTTTSKSTIRFCSATEFKSKLSKTTSPIIIDLRADSLFEKKHIVDAKNIDTSLAKLSGLMTDTTASYFIYGESVSSIDSNILYVNYLAKYRNISILKFGFDSWITAGFPIYEKVDTPKVSTTIIDENKPFHITQTDNKIAIVSTKEIPATYSLFSIDGLLLFEGNIQSETVVSTESFPKGIYILSLKYLDRIESIEIVK